MTPDPTPPHEAQAAAVEKIADLISTLVKRFKTLGHTSQESIAMAEIAMRQSLSRAAQVEAANQAQAKQAPE